ncbi:GNAT family N-acetyltransferase [Chitiniphilus eburneus]|uniref:Acetyltransferase n=1 Tax=Chitiniphilus eburneus TaxID=2571148 RepID=A0A4U0PB66_9NEIS|nr:GNAT family N-acetyltransferase [Chitiniphilus eburneus]TJZ64740.1 acetyltransferase [Chitiniphilus eburneus]
MNPASPLPTRDDPLDWQHLDAITSYPYGMKLRVARDGDTLLLKDGDTELGRCVLERGDTALLLRWQTGRQASDGAILAALEAAFTFHPDRAVCRVSGFEPSAALRNSGVLVAEEDGGLAAHRDLLWQQPTLWLPQPQQAMAQQYVLSGGRRHPRRRPKPQGALYQRFIPWLGRTFSFRALDIDDDLPMFNRWMNDPAVAQIWQEEGDLARHRAYLEELAANPHIYPMIASLDGEPFAYFEAYWAKENRISPFCDAADYDRGWHVLVGEPAYRGKAVAVAWLTSISHYLLLDDARTQRLVGEPRADHAQQIRNLDRSGYAKVKEFDFPHKRALLVTLLRERYFVDAFWWPRRDGATPTSPTRSL